MSKSKTRPTEQNETHQNGSVKKESPQQKTKSVRFGDCEDDLKNEDMRHVRQLVKEESKDRDGDQIMKAEQESESYQDEPMSLLAFG